MSRTYDIAACMRRRRSVRTFLDKPVERDKILTCLEAARRAPSAENIQPWRYIVLEDRERGTAFGKKVFSGIYRPTRWALKAPVLLVLASDKHFIAHKIAGALQRIPFHVIDLGISGEHAVLQAQELGLGTCWIGWFSQKKARRFLKLPSGTDVYGIIAMGYPLKTKGKQRSKKAMAEIAFLDEWGTPFPEPVEKQEER